MFRSFLGRIGRTRVRVDRERREEKKKKEKHVKKMRKSGSCAFYVAGETGRF